jgi:hypothetical protein
VSDIRKLATHSETKRKRGAMHLAISGSCRPVVVTTTSCLRFADLDSSNSKVRDMEMGKGKE